MLLQPSSSKVRPTSVFQRSSGLTLVEVMVASAVLGIVMAGSLAALLQSRRLTEGSIYQSAATTVVQGYLEQIKENKITNIPYYSGTTLIPGSENDPILGVSSAKRNLAIKTYLNNTDVDVPNPSDETISDFLLISSGTPVNPKTLVPNGATPTGVEDNVKLIDVNKTVSKSDDLRLRLWIWVTDASNSGIDATNVRSITIVYQWAHNDGRNTRWFVSSVRCLRSAVQST